MSTTVTSKSQPTNRPLEVTHTRVLLSEWTKFRSLRSTVWTLAIAALLTIALGALFAGVAAAQWDSTSRPEQMMLDPTRTSLAGISMAQLAVGVLGVLMISGEYTTGMIRASLTVVPRRLPVLWAKLAVVVATVLPVMAIASLAAFLLGQWLLSSTGIEASLSTPGALRSVLGAALYVTVAGMIALAIGALLRTTAAGISVFVGVFFVIPPLAGLLPQSIGSVGQYLPSNAGSALYGGSRMAQDQLSAWTGFTVLCLYAVVLIGVAAWRLRRTDA